MRHIDQKYILTLRVQKSECKKITTYAMTKKKSGYTKTTVSLQNTGQEQGYQGDKQGI